MKGPTQARCVSLGVGGLLAGTVTGLIPAATAHGGAVAYLVNGHGVCAKVADGLGLQELTAAIGADFGNSDAHHAIYIVNQAVSELCPGQIRNPRRSAAGYRPGSRS